MYTKEKKRVDDLKSENEKLRARLSKYETVDTLSEGENRNQEEEDVIEDNVGSPLKTEQEDFDASSQRIFGEQTKPEATKGKDESYEEIRNVDQEQEQD